MKLAPGPSDTRVRSASHTPNLPVLDSSGGNRKPLSPNRRRVCRSAPSVSGLDADRTGLPGQRPGRGRHPNGTQTDHGDEVRSGAGATPKPARWPQPRNAARPQSLVRLRPAACKPPRAGRAVRTRARSPARRQAPRRLPDRRRAKRAGRRRQPVGRPAPQRRIHNSSSDRGHRSSSPLPRSMHQAATARTRYVCSRAARCEDG